MSVDNTFLNGYSYYKNFIEFFSSLAKQFKGKTFNELMNIGFNAEYSENIVTFQGYNRKKECLKT